MLETLGKRIRLKRKAQGLGLREAAGKLQISFAYLSRIETNDQKTPPSEELLKKIAQLLNDNIDELMSAAERVPTDIKEQFAKDPGLSHFLRMVWERGLTSKDLEEFLHTKGK